MMLVPIMKIDLFELANNHMWRTEFAFTKWGEAPPAFMEIQTNAAGLTERGWIQYGFKNYYALLNCGFRLRPTAGTASGVHPVPLGFSRVYVKLDGGFDYDAWMRGLDEGRSFVTTGPMLLVKVNGFDPGHVFKQPGKNAATYSLTGTAQSIYPLDSVELVVNGRVAKTIEPENRLMPSGAYSAAFDANAEIASSSWMAVRCIERRPDGRIRFAHTAPFHVEVEAKPLRPRKAEVDFLIQRMQEQIDRNKGVLSEDALDEYQRTLGIYRSIAQSAQ